MLLIRFLMCVGIASAFNPLNRLPAIPKIKKWTAISAPPKDVIETYLRIRNDTLAHNQNPHALWADAQTAHETDLAQFFNQYPNITVDASREKVRNGFHKQIKAFLHKMNKGVSPETILDIESTCGCSTASIAATFPDASVTGVDINGFNIALTSIENQVIHWVHGNTSALPFDDASFDLVTLDHVLGSKSFEEIISTVNEAGRVLKHGGMVAILDTSDRDGLPDYAFTLDKVKYILEHAGFACIELGVDLMPGTVMIVAWRTVGSPIPVRLSVPRAYHQRALRSNWTGMSLLELVAFVIQFVLAYAWAMLLTDLIRGYFKV